MSGPDLPSGPAPGRPPARRTFASRGLTRAALLLLVGLVVAARLAGLV